MLAGIIGAGGRATWRVRRQNRLEVRIAADSGAPSSTLLCERIAYFNGVHTVSAAEDFKNCPIIRASEKGGTIYLVEYSTSDNAKETTYEKVKRLILNDSDAFKPISAW